VSRKAYFWYEFTLIVGGSFLMLVGDQTWGLVSGIACIALGCFMFCLSVIRSRKAHEPLEPEASRAIRK
jgi:hypothetical protein